MIQWINVFQKRCLKRIHRVAYRDHITKEEVLQRSDLEHLSRTVNECLVGHVLHMPKNRYPKIALCWILHGGKRKQGWPWETWHQTLKEILKIINIGINIPSIVQLLDTCCSLILVFCFEDISLQVFLDL